MNEVRHFADSAGRDYLERFFPTPPANLRAIKKMAIGVGDKSAALPNGVGRLFIDDIRLTRGVPVEPNVVTP